MGLHVEAACPGPVSATRLGLSPLYWPSLRVRTQYRVFLGFTHSLELLLLLNHPRMLGHGQGGRGSGEEEVGTSFPLHIFN